MNDVRIMFCSFAVKLLLMNLTPVRGSPVVVAEAGDSVFLGLDSRGVD